MTSVPKLWPESTIVCVASGPSLTREDIDAVRGKAKVIVVNTSYRLALWADALYACDAKWWAWHKGASDFAGMKYSLDMLSKKWPGVKVLKNTGTFGLESSPTGLRTGKNSGYQAIGLAVHLGARRIVLLGYDMQPGPDGREHWHADHPSKSRSPYESFRRHYETIVVPLQKRGVEVLNASRETALTMFPRVTLEAALASREVAA